MGRCNNRRAQERAAQERNVPSRARFSKGPPKKNGGRGGGRGGRGGRDDEGRGGRGGRGGRNNDAVVQKIQNRVQQQRQDFGGISIVKSKGGASGDANIASISRKRKHALDGIDVNKLDTITLSEESVAIVERLLRAYNVWEGDGEDNENEEKINVEIDRNGVEGDAKMSLIESSNYAEEEKLVEKMNSKSSNPSLGADLGDEKNYDDYHGDYDDEPDYQGRKDGINFDHVDRENDYDDDSNADEESDDDSESLGEGDDDPNIIEEEKLINSPIYRHLSRHFSFQQQEVVLALRASHKRLRLAKQKAAEAEGGNDDATDTKDDNNEAPKEDEGALLEMAMDWLSLHLKESDLRRGFRVQKISKPSRTGPRSMIGPSAERTHSPKDFPIKAVPHESISIMPKLTQAQYEKETKESLIRLKRLNLMTDLIRMGFHSEEVEQVFLSMQIEVLLGEDSTGDDGDLQPLSLFNGELLKNLGACVESEDDNKEPSTLDQDVEQEMEEATIMERDQEKEVLEAIYADGFQLLSDSPEGSSGNLHYRVEVNPNTPLTHPACNEKCHLHVLSRRGYPLTSSPTLWFTNTTLPPTLLRRISINLKNKAKELVGQAAVYDLMEYLSEDLDSWQQQFIDEEALAEKKSENIATSQGGTEHDDDEIDYYINYTVEERKKLSRRQRQKLRAVEKSHARDEVLLERQRLKEQKNGKRQERIRMENETVASRMADRLVNNRWKEWVEDEAEKAARRAMNDSFLRGEERNEAREAAKVARKEMLRFHGELEEEEENDKQNEKESVVVNETKVKATRDDSKTKSEAVPHTDQTEGIEVGAQVAEGNDSAPAPQKIKSEATPKTLLFVEKLRRMYEEKAKEKAAGAGNSEDSSKFGTLHLTEAPSNTNVELVESTQKAHVPAPVVAPSPGIEDVLNDVLTTQRDQPWLISPEARVPAMDEKSSGGEKKSNDEARKNRISKILREELERKYSQGGQRSQGNGGRQNSQHRNGSANKYQQMLLCRSKLPAYKMRDELLSTIHNNQVTVVSGDTGCGKTTQVPQLVLDDLILNNRGAEANIIVTQPRRISAIGVSERIADERCERIGESVGYSIRLESKRSSKTRLLLCTTGILLRRLQCDPDLASVSHVFVDEVHERDLNTDFLLIILKDLLQRRKSLKLVLMSATLNADRFSNYFGGCPKIAIAGRAQPVKEYRLEDALECTGHLVLEPSDCAKKRSSRGAPSGADDERLSKSTLKRLYPNYSKNVIDSLAVVDESVTNYKLIGELLEHICTKLEEGAILVFLSGMKEITTAMEALTKIEYFRDSTNAVIYPLHSSLSNAEQKIIFQRPPKGIRKIVLSTNIAETSITIDDVVFVVDAGRVKENRYDDLNKMPTLTECWESKAAAKQRKGRAGRVKPGFCWHLYSSHTHNNVLDDYQLPEMLRVGLEDLVLQILVLDLGEPAIFLTKAVDPPTDLSIKNALQLLESLGAAECDWDLPAVSTEERGESTGLEVSTSLTALGYHLATLPVHPRVGKLLIYGALFGVFEECLTIAAAMTSRSPFVSPFGNRDAADEAKRGFASDDHIAVLLAFNEWRELRQRDGREAKAFLRDNFLSYIALSNIIQLKKQLEKYMKDIGFGKVKPRGNSHTDESDLHLIRAVIAAGLYPNIVIAPRSFSGKTAGEVAFRGQKNGEIYLHPSTIAFTAKELGSRYGCYHEIMKTSKIYIRDCTAVSKFAILLFGGSLTVYQTHGVAAVDNWLKFRVSAKPATLVKYLRSSMENLLLEKIMDPSVDVAESPKGRAVIDAVAALLKMEGGK